MSVANAGGVCYLSPGGTGASGTGVSTKSYAVILSRPVPTVKRACLHKIILVPVPHVHAGRHSRPAQPAPTGGWSNAPGAMAGSWDACAIRNVKERRGCLRADSPYGNGAQSWQEHRRFAIAKYIKERSDRHRVVKIQPGNFIAALEIDNVFAHPVTGGIGIMRLDRGKYFAVRLK